MPPRNSEKSAARPTVKVRRNARTRDSRKRRLRFGTLAALVCAAAIAATLVPDGLAELRTLMADPGAKPPKLRPVGKPPAPGAPPKATEPNPSASESADGGPPVPESPVVFNSPWNGAVWQVERYLKRHLHDTSSFEAIAWGPVTRTRRGYRVWCTYKARNVLGVYATQTRTFLLGKNGEVYAVKD